MGQGDIYLAFGRVRVSVGLYALSFFFLFKEGCRRTLGGKQRFIPWTTPNDAGIATDLSKNQLKPKPSGKPLPL